MVAERSAVILLPDDRTKTGLAVPLLLSPASGAPLLAWLTEALASKGTERFFLLCPKEFLEAAKKCFPDSCSLMTCDQEDPGDFLHVFLSTTPMNEQQVLLIGGPAVYLPRSASRPDNVGERRSPAQRVRRQKLMEALDGGDLPAFLRESRSSGQAEGFYAVSSAVELAAFAERMNQDKLLRLLSGGVQIWDLHNCYVDPRAEISPGSELLPGVILRGRTKIGRGSVIGPNCLLENAVIGDGCRVNASQIYDSNVESGCQIGPFAHIRPGTHMGENAKAGAFVELKNTNLGENAKAPHLSYLGDSDIGERTNVGCGVATANFDRAEKHRTEVGADSFIGCHSCLVAPVTLGEGSYVAAGSVVTQDVPAGALAVARSRQVNKKDWASKHKK